MIRRCSEKGVRRTGALWVAVGLAAACCGYPSLAQEAVPNEHFVDVGAEGDDALIGPGIYQREGPVDDMGPVFDSTFRWCQDAFTLNLPTFPNRLNEVSMRMRARPGHELLVESGGRPIAIARGVSDYRLGFFLPAGMVGERDMVPVTLRAPVVFGPASERDTRVLYGPLDWVRVQPVETPGMPEDVTPLVIKVGDPGDEAFLADGFYHREGPYAKFGDFFRDTFRWAQPGFALRLPVFTGSANAVIMWASIAGEDTTVIVRDGDRQVGVLEAEGANLYRLTLPAAEVGERRWIVLSFWPEGPVESANPSDSRRLFCALSRVAILGEGEAQRLFPDVPATHGLKVASYEARYQGSMDGARRMALAERIGFSRDAARKLAPQLRQEAAVILANGCLPTIWDEATGPVADRTAQKALEEFVAPRRDSSVGTASVPYVAVVEPEAYRVACGQQATSALRRPGALLSAVELLNRLHYPCDVIPDSADLATLQRYALVVVPSPPWYTEELWPRLREYVGAGGAVLATGSASLGRDEDGELGLALGETLGLRARGKSLGDGRIPASGYFAHVGTAQLVSATTAEQLLPLCSTDRPEKEALDAPGVTLNRYGEGRAVYVAGELFAAAAVRMDPLAVPVLKRALEAAVPEPLAELEGPGTVEIALRRKGATMFVHLANRAQHADHGSGPAYVETVLPTGPVTLKLRCEAAPKSIVDVPDGRLLKSEWQDGVLTVRIPGVHVHTAVALTF